METYPAKKYKENSKIDI